jgi:hypothetical protein
MSGWDEMIARSQPRYDEIAVKLGDADLVKEVYNLGFSHGQQYTHYARSGFGISQEEWEAYRPNHIVCSSNGVTKHYKVLSDNSWEEINDPNQDN